jgi:hypothetical protein
VAEILTLPGMISVDEQKANAYYLPMDESRKRVIGIMASILAARKLAQLDSTRPSPASNSAIQDAITFAQRIMQRIDDLFPAARKAG